MNARKKALFSLVTLLAAATMLEGSARVLHLVRQPAEPTGRAVHPKDTTRRDPVLHHRLLPNIKVWDDAREIPHWLITNSQGWEEDHDVSKTKPPGTYRIFYIGDSNVQGVVGLEDKMAKLVERGLNEAIGDAADAVDSASDTLRRFEVINAGTSSYSPLLYYLQLKNDVLRYDPDLVVVNVDMTDVVNDYVYSKTMVVAGQGDIVAVLPSSYLDTSRYRMTPEGLVELSSAAPVQHWLVSHSTFCYYFDRLVQYGRGTTRADTRVDGLLDGRANWLAHEWSPQIEDSVQRTLGFLKRSVELLRAHGVMLMLTGVPHCPQYDGTWSARPHQVLQRFADEQGVPYLDSYHAVKTAAGDRDMGELYWPSDPTHFNIEGNHVWARVQLAFLLDPSNALLPPALLAGRD